MNEPFSIYCFNSHILRAVLKIAEEAGWMWKSGKKPTEYSPLSNFLTFHSDGMTWGGIDNLLPFAEAIKRIEAGSPKPDPRPVCRFNGVGRMRDSSIEVIAEYLAYRKADAAWQKRQEAK
jgi:hypothetical protein